MEKKCNCCSKIKVFSEFNTSRTIARHEDGKHNVCRQCDKLKHRIYTILAHEQGYSSRDKWRKAISASDRRMMIADRLKEMLQSAYECAPIQSDNPVDSVPDAVRNALKAKIKDSRKKRKEIIGKIKDELDSLDFDEGYVYIITHPEIKGIKIGESIDPEGVRLVNYQTYHSNPAYRVNRDFYFNDRRAAEAEIKMNLSNRKIHGEWFDMTVEEGVLFIDKFQREREKYRGSQMFPESLELHENTLVY